MTRDGKVSTLILEGKYSRELPDTQFDVLFANHEGIEAVLCDLDGDLGGRRGLFFPRLSPVEQQTQSLLAKKAQGKKYDNDS